MGGARPGGKRERGAVEWSEPQANRVLSPGAALAELVDAASTWTGRPQLAEELVSLLLLAAMAVLAVWLLLALGGRGARSGARGAARAAVLHARDALDGAPAPANAQAGAPSAAGSEPAGDGLPPNGSARESPGAELELPGAGELAHTILEEEEDGDAAPTNPQPRAHPPALGAAAEGGRRRGQRAGGFAPARSPLGPAGGLSPDSARVEPSGRLSRSAVEAHTDSHEPHGARCAERSPSEAEASVSSRLSRATHRTARSAAMREAVRDGMRRRPHDPFDQAVLRNAVSAARCAARAAPPAQPRRLTRPCPASQTILLPLCAPLPPSQMLGSPDKRSPMHPLSSPNSAGSAARRLASPAT